MLLEVDATDKIDFLKKKKTTTSYRINIQDDIDSENVRSMKHINRNKPHSINTFLCTKLQWCFNAWNRFVNLH